MRVEIQSHWLVSRLLPENNDGNNDDNNNTENTSAAPQPPLAFVITLNSPQASALTCFHEIVGQKDPKMGMQITQSPRIPVGIRRGLRQGLVAYVPGIWAEGATPAVLMAKRTC